MLSQDATFQNRAISKFRTILSRKEGVCGKMVLENVVPHEVKDFFLGVKTAGY